MASKKYVVWDEESIVVTPSGEVFTAEQWLDRYPMGRLDTIDLVLSGGAINGAICYVYQEMIDIYEKFIDFSECTTKQDCLDLIAEFEEKADTNGDDIITPEERIAAALEAQVMLAMDDVTIE